MPDRTELHCDAASTLFNLPGYRVEHVDPVETVGPGSPRRVFVVAEDQDDQTVPTCPDCGQIAARRHSRRWQRVRDVPVAGPVQVYAYRVRWACTMSSCPRATFTAVTEQLPLRARSTTRLKTAVITAVCQSRRVVSEVATAMGGLSWATVAGFLDDTAAAVLIPEFIDRIPVRALGIDEHRYRTVRFFRDTDGTWQRHEPWMSTLVDLDTGLVLGVVDGRGSAGVSAWLAAELVKFSV